MTTPMWTPDHPVDAELAETLIRTQFPELAGPSPTLVGRGFDADVWRVGDTVFRFPRRKVAVPLVETEMRVLSDLAPHLPLPIPAPIHMGAPSEAFPYQFYGHRYLEGLTADRARLDDAERTAIAPALGRFLRALHAIPLAEAEALGVLPDTFRSDHAARAARARTQLPYFEGTRWESLIPELSRWLDHPVATPVGEPLVLLHGDIYARHLLLDADHQLSGILDWGDLCLGDPSIDLDVVYTFLPAEARPAFWAAYGEVSEDMRNRARYTALLRHGILIMAYALDVGDTVLEEESGRAIANALA